MPQKLHRLLFGAKNVVNQGAQLHLKMKEKSFVFLIINRYSMKKGTWLCMQL